MGRLENIKKTFLANIEDNLDYPDVEWVLINYNSPDGLEQWAKDNLKEYIFQNKVLYIKVIEKDFFHMSHAKNVGHRLSTGDIICNVDADNFTGKSFAKFLAESFLKNDKTVLHGDISIAKSSTGRLALRRELFQLLGGYNEEFVGWGNEDADLFTRAEYAGFKSVIIAEKSFLNVIAQEDSERVLHYKSEDRNIKETSRKNVLKAEENYLKGKFIANQLSPWGATKFYRNFSSLLEEI